MRRLQLFEFGDQPWFPRVLRDAETAYLAVAYRVTPLARLWAEKIATALQPGGANEILDLCSGSGGAMPAIVRELEKLGFKPRVRLTDLYPNSAAASRSRMSRRITWVAEPVDVRNVPSELAGVRTMFSAFHHFRPEAAKAILKNAFDLGRTICIFEAGTGTLPGMASMALVPFNVLLLMPFARPFRWSHLLFTYLIPLLPAIVLWDGIVSMLRIYSPQQMRGLTSELQRPGYRWEAGLIKVRGIPGGLPYLIGGPNP